MSETYEDYEQEFQEYLSRLRSFLTSQARSQTTLRQCDLLLTHAQRCATAMTSLAQTKNDSFLIHQAHIRIREMEPLQQEVNRVRKEAEHAARGVLEVEDTDTRHDSHNANHDDEEEKRQRLLGYQPPDLERQQSQQHPQLFGNEDTQALISNSETLLMETQALCAESDQIGSETLFTMGRQRDQLENASGYMNSANQVIQKAKDVLEAMNRKALRNKRVLYGIIVLLIFANVAVIIAIIKKKK